MKIVYKRGDLFKRGATFIAHGCNAKGVMGSGFALQIKQRFPAVYDYYRTTYIQTGLHLGSVYGFTENGTMILNCITQSAFGREHHRYVSYDAIRSCVQEINEIVPKGVSVCMPKIGAGLGGGVWSEIEQIIEQESKTFQPIVYEL